MQRIEQLVLGRSGPRAHADFERVLEVLGASEIRIEHHHVAGRPRVRPRQGLLQLSRLRQEVLQNLEGDSLIFQALHLGSFDNRIELQQAHVRRPIVVFEAHGCKDAVLRRSGRLHGSYKSVLQRLCSRRVVAVSCTGVQEHLKEVRRVGVGPEEAAPTGLNLLAHLRDVPNQVVGLVRSDCDHGRVNDLVAALLDNAERRSDHTHTSILVRRATLSGDPQVSHGDARSPCVRPHGWTGDRLLPAAGQPCVGRLKIRLATRSAASLCIGGVTCV